MRAIAIAIGILLTAPSLGVQAKSFRRRPVLRIDRVDATKPPMVRIYLTELDRAMELVETTERELASEEKAWASLCQALLATNEFRYID